MCVYMHTCKGDQTEQVLDGKTHYINWWIYIYMFYHHNITKNVINGAEKNGYLMIKNILES